jgi:hypothetical protein
MALDLRIPIGLLFGLLGLLLAVYGFATGPEAYQKSLGINVNAWWGLAMLAFGAVMLALAWRASPGPGRHVDAKRRAA